jgi:hypothetical protein
MGHLAFVGRSFLLYIALFDDVLLIVPDKSRG